MLDYGGHEDQTLNHTYFSAEYFLFSVAHWLNNFEEGLEEPKITQPPGLVVELLPLRLLGDADEDVGAFFLEQMVKRVLPGFLEELVLDGDERGFPEALQRQNHAVGQKAVHHNAGGHQVHPP